VQDAALGNDAAKNTGIKIYRESGASKWMNATVTALQVGVLRDFIDPTIAAISTIMILVSTTLLLATQFLGSRDRKGQQD